MDPSECNFAPSSRALSICLQPTPQKDPNTVRVARTVLQEKHKKLKKPPIQVSKAPSEKPDGCFSEL
jgi:hypothetical protein